MCEALDKTLTYSANKDTTKTGEREDWSIKALDVVEILDSE